MPPRRANVPTRLTSDHPPSITSKQHTSITNHYCARGRVAKKAKRGRTKRASCERPPRPRALSASLPASLGPCALCVCQACTPARIQRESPPRTCGSCPGGGQPLAGAIRMPLGTKPHTRTRKTHTSASRSCQASSSVPQEIDVARRCRRQSGCRMAPACHASLRGAAAADIDRPPSSGPTRPAAKRRMSFI